ncbi:hypothetical protein HanPI659440_Chr05g0197671 [Helianthus annuus]|nr:hypothetical protein HanPI659440_Chr05g0197671 [Helianthus annuus]
MAGSGSPQFMSVCSVTTTASGVICLLTLFIHAVTIIFAIIKEGDRKYGSNYKWSMIFIFVVQSVGVVLGTVAPICRCVVYRHVKLVFTVEKYWYQKLQDWNNSTISYHGTMSSISLRFCSHQLKIKNLILRFCILKSLIIYILKYKGYYVYS